MNLVCTATIVSLITFFMAYVVVVTIAGAFRAWVALRMGDDTAEQWGFLTLNPLMHIDPIGLLFLLIFTFGWGRFVPINPLAITGPWRRARLALAYLSDSIAYFFSALIGITALIMTYGIDMLYAAQMMLLYIPHANHLYLAQQCPTFSSFSLVIAFIAIAFIYLNIVLGVLNLLLNGFNYLFFLISERSVRYNEYMSIATIVVPIVLIFFLSEPLRIMVIQIIASTGFVISRMLGAI